MNNIIFLCDSHHGVYVPSFFCSHSENIWDINPEDWNYIANSENIENDDYWDIWNAILDNACYRDENGIIWTLHHDGDLFAVALNEMSEQEIEEFFL